MSEKIFFGAYSVGVVAWLFGYMPGSLLVVLTVCGAGVVAAIETKR